jgi:hypothetical protein
VALAVPTIFGANIIEVWNWVITKEAPMKPIKNLQIRNCNGVCTNPNIITGMAPKSNK